MHLIIDSYGAKLSCENKMFCLSNDKEKIRFAVQKVKSIQIAKGVRLTSDVLCLAIDHNIRVVITSKSGKPLGELWHGRFGSIASIRKQQLYFAQSHQALHWAQSVIEQRITAQLNLCYQLAHFVSEFQSKIEKNIAAIVLVQKKLTGQHVFHRQDIEKWKASLRGWEGTASKYYFNTLSLALPPVYRFEQRSRKPATDFFNCVLNYLYGVLYGLIESALIHAGIDPYIGVFHSDQYNRPVLTYDCIEAYRHWVEEATLRLCWGQLLTTKCFEKKDKGFWLSADGRKLVIPTFESYLDQIIPYQNQRRKRRTHIQLDAQAFAQEVKRFKPKNP